MNSFVVLKRTLGPYLLGILIALGATIAWLLAIAIVFVPYQLLKASYSAEIHKSLEITVDGNALLVTSEPSLVPVASQRRMPNGQLRTTNSNWIYTYHTLDGELVAIPMTFQHGASLIPGPTGRAAQITGPSIYGFLSTGPRAAYWYAIYSGDTQGHAYFAGFDPITKRSVGYLGPTGFDIEPPAVDEQFTIDASLFHHQAAMAPDYGTPGAEPINDPASTQLLVSDGKLYEIAFDEQSVRLVDMPSRVVALGTSRVPAVENDAKELNFAQRIVVRLVDELVVLLGDESDHVPIPPAARDRDVTLYATLNNQAVLKASGEADSPIDVYWIDASGTVVREETVELPSRVPDVSGGSLVGAFVAPAPWFWVFPSSEGSRQPGLITKWRPAALVCVVSALFAVICYRRQRAISQGGAVAWAALVFVLGPPGFVGYWTHRRWPPQRRCEDCGAVVPRDRETCRACAAEFPQPALEGIEVFA